MENLKIPYSKKKGLKMSKIFAYIRVSTREQNENRQLDALKDLNIDEIVVEKASGKNFVGRETNESSVKSR